MGLEAMKMRVLLVEEDPIQRLIVREYLEIGNRYTVLEVLSLHTILAICENPLPGLGLVLLDMEWSRVDTVDLILEIRRRNHLLPILGMSDCPSDLYGDSRLRGCPFGFIPKPFSPFQLNRSITATFRAHAAREFRRPESFRTQVGSGTGTKNRERVG